MARVVFVTGTDTGAGKTLLTGLLLCHLRATGCRALAMKPFCSGGLGDVRLLDSLQAGELTREEINPFFFPEPVAPLLGARAHRRRIPADAVIERVRALAARCDCLLVEGAGGLLAPLGEGYSALDLVRELGCEVIVAARNRLGVVNHSLLTLSALRAVTSAQARIVLMGTVRPDASVKANARLVRELGGGARIFSVDFLGRRCLTPTGVRRAALRCRSILARLVEPA